MHTWLPAGKTTFTNLIYFHLVAKRPLPHNGYFIVSWLNDLYQSAYSDTVMGVKDLWKLLEPAGRPIRLESLEGLILAIGNY